MSIPQLTTQHLKEGIYHMPDNAAGLDGVQKGDLTILSDAALEWIVAMLRAIELGAPWPDQTLAGRTAWLDKTEGPTPSTNPLDYRGLAILSKVYRLYGVVRLRHLHPWIKTWEYEELFAVTTAPCGAEDAWYLMGIDLELARLTELISTGGSADIWKCFDQIQRTLLYFLLEMAGFPSAILNAYRSFHEAVHYHNTIGNALGAPHRKHCSIPQGCPFSMMMVGFSFHPWVALMKTMGAKPRGLADDLTIVAFGPGHEVRFRDAYSATMHYLRAFGAKPAPSKCLTFSSSAETRAKLAVHYWQVLQSNLAVISDTRDLGAHLTVTARLKGATLTQRIQKATVFATKLAFFPWSWEAKRQVVDTLILPMALYGVEAVPASDSALAKLDAAIAKVVGPYSHNSSVALATLLASPKKNLSSTHTVLWRSCSLLRRIITKHPKIKMKIGLIWDHYARLGKPGIEQGQSPPCPSLLAPPPGHGSRAQWNNSVTDFGPIGLLASRIHCVGADVTKDFFVRMAPHIRFDILECPHQYLKKHVADIVGRALSQSISASRTFFDHCGAIDVELYHRCLRKVNDDHKPGLIRVQFQAQWIDAQQHLYYQSLRKAHCPHCNEVTTSILHLWECKQLMAFRKSIDADIAELSPANTPHHLLIGIPEYFDAGVTGDYATGARDGRVGDIYLHSLCTNRPALHAHEERSIKTLTGDDRAFDSQHLAYRILGYVGASSAPGMHAVQGTAPTRPNVATDGGLKHSGIGLAFGTFGTWGPARHWAQISPEELHFAQPPYDEFNDRPGGILLAEAIPGVFCSSTRAELAGIISALVKPCPIHIALDNRAVADRIKLMLNGDCHAKRSWKLQPDGDLWAIVDTLTQQRGEYAKRISWTKGHASWQWIASQSNHATTIANGQADHAASRGTDAVGKSDDAAVLDFHATKRTAYENLVVRIQRHAAALIHYDEVQRELTGVKSEGKTQAAEFIDYPNMNPRVDFILGIPMDLLTLPPDCSIHDVSDVVGSACNPSTTNYSMLHAFWSSLRWRVHEQSRPHNLARTVCSLYRLLGGGPRDFDPHTAQPPLHAGYQTIHQN